MVPFIPTTYFIVDLWSDPTVAGHGPKYHSTYSVNPRLHADLDQRFAGLRVDLQGNIHRPPQGSPCRVIR